MESKVKKDEKMPLVSVCIPAYNHEKYIAETIQSVINQDYKNIELIIINDGSKDNTHEVIMNFEKKCKERFVRFVYKNRENRGLVKTLNEMIDISNGEYIKFIASDDLLYEGSISKFVKKMMKDNLDILYGKLLIIDEEGRIIKVEEGLKLPKQKFDFSDFNLESVLLQSPVFGSSWIMKRKSLIDIGGYSEVSKIEDWDLAIRVILNNLKKGYTQDISSCYRVFKNKGPHFGSYLNWLKEDLKIINQYKYIDKKLYKQAIKRVFKQHFIWDRLYKSEDFSAILKELLTNYPFSLTIFLNPRFLLKMLFGDRTRIKRILKAK